MKSPAFTAWLDAVTAGLSAPAARQVEREANTELQRLALPAQDPDALLPRLGDPATLNAEARRVHLTMKEERRLQSSARHEARLTADPNSSRAESASLLLPYLVLLAVLALSLHGWAALLLLPLIVSTLTRPARIARTPAGLKTSAYYTDVLLCLVAAPATSFLLLVASSVPDQIARRSLNNWHPFDLSLDLAILLFLAGLGAMVFRITANQRNLTRRLERSLPDPRERAAWFASLADPPRTAPVTVTTPPVPSTPRPSTPPMSAETWLALACEELADPARVMIEREIRGHLDDAATDGLSPEDAVRGLGDPLLANAQYRQVHLSRAAWRAIRNQEWLARELSKRPAHGRYDSSFIVLSIFLVAAVFFALSNQPGWAALILTPFIAERLNRPRLIRRTSPALLGGAMENATLAASVLSFSVLLLSVAGDTLTRTLPGLTLVRLHRDWPGLLLGAGVPLALTVLCGLIALVFATSERSSQEQLRHTLPAAVAPGTPDQPGAYWHTLEPWLNEDARNRRRTQMALDLSASIWRLWREVNPDVPLPATPESQALLDAAWVQDEPLKFARAYTRLVRARYPG